jgi:hypothetical protein
VDSTNERLDFDLFLFSGAEVESYRTILTAKLLAVLAEGAVLTHKLEALRALRKPEHLRCLLALDANCHCKTKVYQTTQ